MDEVDGNHLPVAEEVADGGEEQSAAPEHGPGLQDEIRPEVEEQLLVDPQIKRALLGLDAEPAGPPPCLGVVVVEVKGIDRVHQSATVASPLFRFRHGEAEG
jgi:hypothetical protein